MTDHLQEAQGLRPASNPALVANQSVLLPALHTAQQQTTNQQFPHLGALKLMLLKQKFTALLLTVQLLTVRQAVQQASELLLERETTVNTKIVWQLTG